MKPRAGATQGFGSFVPCVSNELTIGLLAVGRRAHGEPLSSEDMSLLTGGGGQAATAIENARLYSQLQDKANEIEAVRQFNANVVRSLTDALVVVDPDDRVLLWNERAETLLGVTRDQAEGSRSSRCFHARSSTPLLRPGVMSPRHHAVSRAADAGAADHRELLVNLAIAPFQRADGGQAGWILVMADITDRAGLEEQLRLSEKWPRSACSPPVSRTR
jgi:PAS domain S-box-containing protein